MPSSLLVSALAFLVSICAPAVGATVTVPLKGPADARPDAVKAEVAKIEGVAEASLSGGALSVTVKEGKQVGLVQLTAALKAASGDDAAIEVDAAKLSLRGVFDLVLLTAAEEGSFAEGAIEGMFSVSGKVTVQAVDTANEPKREAGEVTIVRVDFTPNEGEDETLEEVRALFSETLLTPATPENGFGIVDVRWGVPAAKEGE